MDISRGTPHGMRARRLGKKAIFYGRVAHALGAIPEKSTVMTSKSSLFTKVKSFKPTKKQLVMAACSVLLMFGAGFGWNAYNDKLIADEKAAIKAEALRVEKKNAVAQECYRQKTTEKTAMLGKITFDQLYDGDACIAE